MNRLYLAIFILSSLNLSAQEYSILGSWYLVEEFEVNENCKSSDLKYRVKNLPRKFSLVFQSKNIGLIENESGNSAMKYSVVDSTLTITNESGFEQNYYIESQEENHLILKVAVERTNRWIEFHFSRSNVFQDSTEIIDFYDYYSNGKIRVRGFIINYKPIGIWTSWHSNGVIERVKYITDEPVFGEMQIDFDSFGNVLYQHWSLEDSSGYWFVPAFSETDIEVIWEPIHRNDDTSRSECN